MKKYLVPVIIVFAFSCSTKDSCRETPYPFSQFESEYGCIDTKHRLHVDFLNSVKIIRDQSSYDAEVTGDCHPNINFNVYDLIIGRQVTDNINDTILYELKNTCPDNLITLTVSLVQSPSAGPDTLTYHALIQKLQYQGNLTVNLILTQE